MESLVFVERGKPVRVLGEEKPRGGWARKTTLKKDAGVNIPDKRWLLKQYSYFMFIIKTICDYFWQIVPLDKAVLTQEMKDLLKLYLVSKLRQVDARWMT